MTLDELTALYAKIAPLLAARARRIIGHAASDGGAADAEDVVHEVFIKLMAAAPSDNRLVPWLYTSCTNVCLDRLRHRARRHEAWQGELRESLQGGHADLDSVLASKDLCRKLLAPLDERTQAIVALVHLDEMTQQEAADHLGVSRKTVVKRLKQFADHSERVVKTWSH